MARKWMVFTAAAARRSKAAAGFTAVAAAVVALTWAIRRDSNKPEKELSFARYPNQYVARRGTVAPIDGDLSKAVWKAAPWSEPFLEIRGKDAPPGSKPSPWQSTKMKMLWDDEYLYIAAVMDVDAGNQITAKMEERNSAIFHTDSDFEVFLDPSGCCHGYKELEMNAINTVWNLMLDRPYMDGGSEFSGRVAKEGEEQHWDVKKQRTAARVTKGRLGNPAESSQWCCEVALAHSDSIELAPTRAAQPYVGGCWRINFSRVEKQGHVNWVWSPQVVWTPAQKRYVGQVNMHLPDAWGYVVFANEEGLLADGSRAEEFRDPTWPARHAAACVYYACHDFRQAVGHFPSSWEELSGCRNGALLRGAELANADVRFLSSRGDGYVAHLTAQGRSVQINEKRLLTVV